MLLESIAIEVNLSLAPILFGFVQLQLPPVLLQYRSLGSEELVLFIWEI